MRLNNPAQFERPISPLFSTSSSTLQLYAAAQGHHQVKSNPSQDLLPVFCSFFRNIHSCSFLTSQFGGFFVRAVCLQIRSWSFYKSQGKQFEPLRPVILRDSERNFGTVQFRLCEVSVVVSNFLIGNNHLCSCISQLKGPIALRKQKSRSSRCSTKPCFQSKVFFTQFQPVETDLLTLSELARRSRRI